ncbi:MAG: CoA pyrophosphatase [Desulfobacteraceae bacterium]|nr:CoA pyrophosphatase [Desulfobacteraceae bacterium]
MNEKDLIQLEKFLPKKPGIYGRHRLFNSAVMITLINIDGEYNFVFEKRAKGIRQEGEICFPGGEYDPENDDSCVNAAIRETSEELGISRENIRVFGRMHTIVAAMGAVIEPFTGIIENISPNDIKIQKSEVEKVFFAPVSWFLENKPETYSVMLQMKPYQEKNGEKKILLPSKELGLPERYHKPWGNIKQSVLLYRFDNELIWGLTAEMISEFTRIYKLSKQKTSGNE